MTSRPVRRRRKGMGTVEWIFVAAGVLLACVLLIGVMGRQVDTKLNDTAQDVADPSALTHRFGN